jgi:uncharacterized protein YndB with AHSA1/START domain
MTNVFDGEIQQNTLVKAPIEKVFDAFTKAEEFNTWFTKETEIDLQPGGRIVFRWRDWGPDKVNLDAEAHVVEVDRPNRFMFKWHGDNASYWTTIDVTLESVEDGTVIRLREYGYEDTPSGHSGILECAAGWGEALTLLKFYVEHGVTY